MKTGGKACRLMIHEEEEENCLFTMETRAKTFLLLMRSQKSSDSMAEHQRLVDESNGAAAAILGLNVMWYMKCKADYLYVIY